jgi:hypothetical protein
MKDQELKPAHKGNNFLPEHLTPISTWVQARCIRQSGSQTSLDDMYADYVQFCKPDLKEEYAHMNIIIFKWAILANGGPDAIKLWKRYTECGTYIYAKDIYLGETRVYGEDPGKRIAEYTTCIPADMKKGNRLDREVINAYWNGRTEFSNCAHIKSWQLSHDFEEWYGSHVTLDELKRALSQNVSDYKYSASSGVCNRKFRDVPHDGFDHTINIQS